MQDIFGIVIVFLAADGVRVAIEIPSIGRCCRVVDDDGHVPGVKRIQPLQFAVRQAVDVGLSIAVMIPAIFQRCEKLYWRLPSIRMDIERDIRLMVRDAILVLVHQMYRQFCKGFSQRLKARKIGYFANI